MVLSGSVSTPTGIGGSITPARNFPGLVEFERRHDLLDSIAQLEDAVETVLPPYVTFIPNNVHAPLAIREDELGGDRGHMQQVLYAIVRAGSHGFGVATAHAPGLHEHGQSYITRINEDPHMQETTLIRPLVPNLEVQLGRGGMLPDLAIEGHSFSIRTNEEAEIRIQSNQHKRGLLRLITATGFSPHLSRENASPFAEVGIWSLPPQFLYRSLRRVKNQLPHPKEEPQIVLPIKRGVLQKVA